MGAGTQGEGVRWGRAAEATEKQRRLRRGECAKSAVAEREDEITNAGAFAILEECAREGRWSELLL